MDEADAISDRIAILQDGKLKAYDTPLNLKAKIGGDYLLSLEMNSSAKDHCDAIQNAVNQVRHSSGCIHYESANPTLVFHFL